jgi:hypothetical protein
MVKRCLNFFWENSGNFIPSDDEKMLDICIGERV